MVDDCSSDETAEIVARYAGDDERIHFSRNDRRLGLVGNWRRAFELANELHPDLDYFAWGSDHDAWHPRWLESLVPELERASGSGPRLPADRGDPRERRAADAASSRASTRPASRTRSSAPR